MPEHPDDSPELEADEMDIESFLPAGTGEGEGEAEAEGEPEEEPELEGDKKRIADTQKWAHELSERLAAAEARNEQLVEMVSRVQMQQQTATARPAGEDRAALNAEAEELARKLGAGGAIRELAAREARNETAKVQQTIEYLASKLQGLELAAQHPDAAKYQSRIAQIYADANAGKLNIDQLTYRLAKAEDLVETAIKTGTVPRKPDSPARGALTGTRGRKAGVEPINPETASDEELQREILRSLTNPVDREQFLRRHPKLRGK